MSTSSIGWSISTIAPAIDICDKFCSKHANNGQFNDLISQLTKLKSVYQDLVPLAVNKIYINLEAIAKTLSQCQVFFHDHPASLSQQWTYADRCKNAGLVERLELDTQTLEVYFTILNK